MTISVYYVTGVDERWLKMKQLIAHRRWVFKAPQLSFNPYSLHVQLLRAVCLKFPKKCCGALQNISLSFFFFFLSLSIGLGVLAWENPSYGGIVLPYTVLLKHSRLFWTETLLNLLQKSQPWIKLNRFSENPIERSLQTFCSWLQTEPIRLESILLQHEAIQSLSGNHTWVLLAGI